MNNSLAMAKNFLGKILLKDEKTYADGLLHIK